MIKGSSKVFNIGIISPFSFAAWVVVCFCFSCVNTWAQNAVDIPEQAIKESSEWQNQFWVYLENSEHAQFRTYVAIRLLHSEIPNSVARGEQIINEVLNSPNPDPVSLWQLAIDCRYGKTHEWCESGGVYERLVKADPGNAAAFMLQIIKENQQDDEKGYTATVAAQIRQEAQGQSELSVAFDTERAEKLIIAAAAADRFDTYWGRGADKLYEEALAYIEINPMPPIPQSVLQLLNAETVDVKRESAAFMVVMAGVVTGQIPAYQDLITYCRLQVRNHHVKTVKACNQLAQIMQNNDGTHLTKMIGLALERVMLEEGNPEDPGIRRLLQRKQVVTIMQMCFVPRWQTKDSHTLTTDKDTLMHWAQNLDRFGEWNGNRVTALQKYKSSPESFSVNPNACDRLPDLDDESLEQFVGDRTGAEIFRDMQAEGFGMSTVVN